MTFIVFNNTCTFNATSSGTGGFVPSSAVDIFHSVPETADVVDGKVYSYYAQSLDGTQSESGSGVYSIATHTLARTTIASNSIGNGDTSVINFSSPPQVDVFPSATPVLSPRSNVWNRVVNGAMMISQENGSSSSGANNFYPVDQFVHFQNTSGTSSVAQVASLTPAGSSSRVRVTVTANTGSITSSQFNVLRTNIEGNDCIDLQFGLSTAKTFVLRFGVRAPAGTYTVVFSNIDVTRSYVFEYTISAGQANTDQVIRMTVPGDLTGTWNKINSIGLMLNWGLAAGSTYRAAAGSWTTGNFYGGNNQSNFLATNGNVFELFDVGLYEGVEAPPFKMPSPATELVRCQRYFEVIGYGNGSTGIGVAQAAATTRALVVLIWKVMKRGTPTVSVSAMSDWAFLNSSAGSYVPWSSFGASVDVYGGMLDVTTTFAGLGGAGQATIAVPNGATGAARVYANSRM